MKDKIVDSFPLFSTILIEYGNAGQLWKMWTKHTAAGQNVWSYIAILFALILWLLFYKFRVPGSKVAYYATWLGIGMMLATIVTIVLLQGGF